MVKNNTDQIDASKPYQFLGVEDHGETCCPHCGADGRYIYSWAEFGKVYSAMAGCYAALTGKIEKGDVDCHIERIAIKQAKNKPLNGWDKTIIRMMAYKSANYGDAGKCAWADRIISEAVSSAKAWSYSRVRG